MSGQVVDPELDHQSDGALRVSRRKALHSLQNAIDIQDRLTLGEHGEYARENTAANLQGSIAASADMLAANIAAELDRRGAEYKTRSDVMGR